MSRLESLPGGREPVFADPGCTAGTIGAIFAVADGRIGGAHFKVDGDTWNPVDRTRVERFMDAARAVPAA